MELTYKDYPVMVMHVQHPFNLSQRIGTVVAMQSGTYIHMGFSQCHPNDQFTKKEGRDIACEAAWLGLEKVEVPFISYAPDGSKRRLYLVNETINILLERALNRWSFCHLSRLNYIESNKHGNTELSTPVT